MPDYILKMLPCWEKDCPETFAVFTDLSHHHLTAHTERPLHGHPVAAWLALVVMQAGTPMRCICGCPYAQHQSITAEAPLQPCGACSCRAFVLALDQAAPLPEVSHAPASQTIEDHLLASRRALAVRQVAQDRWEKTATRCRECNRPVPDSPDHLRLQLCAVCAVCGLLAYCATCGESHPEHGLGGRGCEAFVRMPDGPLPVLEEDAAPMPWPISAFGAFSTQCLYRHVPHNTHEARLFLEAMGVPPDAPAAGFEAAIEEAVQRWEDRTHEGKTP